MIEIPCFWYSRPSRYEFIVSDRPEAGFKPSPMHYRKGVLHSKIRISKYIIDGNYTSQTGTMPVSTTMNIARSNLRAKGMYCIDYPTWCCLVMLMIIKYANMDVQSVVGYGHCVYNGSGLYVSGGADNVLGLDGSPTTISAVGAVKVFGLENFWSNNWKNMDGIYAYNRTLYIKDVEDVVSDPVDYNELVNNYIKISTNVPGSSGSMISDIAYDDVFDWMLFPTALGVSACNDGCYINDGFNAVMVGGGFEGEVDGLFATHIQNNAYVGMPACTILAIEIVPNDNNILYIDNNDSAYGVSNSVFSKLTDDFSTLTDTDKLSIFNGLNGLPSMNELSTLDMPIFANNIKNENELSFGFLRGLPKNQLVIPDAMTTIPTNAKINLVSISGKGNIKVAITKDGNIYEIYNFMSKSWETIDINDISTKGMDFTEIDNISSTSWEVYNPTQLGFAFYLNQENIEDEVEVSKITINYFS